MRCPTGTLIEQIGDRWIFHLLHQLAHRAQRTQALLEGLKGISSRTLAVKLKQLEADGWITRRVYPEVPPRVEYALSEKGQSLMPLLTALKSTGEAVFPDIGVDCPSCQHSSAVQSKSIHSPPRPATPPRPEAQPPRRPAPVEDVVLL